MTAEQILEILKPHVGEPGFAAINMLGGWRLTAGNPAKDLVMTDVQARADGLAYLVDAEGEMFLDPKHAVACNWYPKPEMPDSGQSGQYQ